MFYGSDSQFKSNFRILKKEQKIAGDDEDERFGN